MPTSIRGRSSNRAPRRAPATRPRSAAGGFTLIEILVVVVIIAILTTIGVMSIGVLGGDRQREQEIEHLEDVAATAIQEAELEGRDFGVRLQQTSYEVYVYSPRRQRWEAVSDDRLYSVHTLPPGITFALTLEGRQVTLDADPPPPGLVPDAHASAQPATGPDGKPIAGPAGGVGAGASSTTAGTVSDIRPQLIFYASGDVSPYHLELRRDGETVPWTLDEAADGTLKALSPSQRANLDAAP